MIIGKDEMLERPCLYHHRSSFFSLNELNYEGGDEYTQVTFSDEKKLIPPIITSTFQKPQQLHMVSNFSDKLGPVKSWPKIVNEKIYINQLRKQQTEQLKPFFLAKSKFLSKIIAKKVPKKRTQLKEIGIVQIESLDQVKLVKKIECDETPKVVVAHTPEEIELIRESQDKCNNWLDMYVLKYPQVNPEY